MKTLAFISAVLCATVIVAIAAPRSATPAYQAHRATITVPSRPADFQSGLTGNDWWAAQSKRAH